MMSQNNNSSTCLMAIYQDILCKPVPECHHSGFYWSKAVVDLLAEARGHICPLPSPLLLFPFPPLPLPISFPPFRSLPHPFFISSPPFLFSSLPKSS